MARREKGSGSWDTVTKNDITYYRYRKKYNGMTSRKEFVGRTKADVKRKIQEFEAKSMRVNQKDYRKMTLGECIDNILQTLEPTFKTNNYATLQSTNRCYIKTNPIADVLWGGGADSLAAFKDYFAPYVCANDDVIAEEYKDPDDKWIGESPLPMVLFYNKDLIEKDGMDIPETWEDLTKPEWKGKIAYCLPSKSGSAYTQLCTMILGHGGKEDGWDFIKKLYDNLDGKIVDSSGKCHKMVADGEFYVGLTLEKAAVQYKDDPTVGFVYPKDGTSAVPDGVALVKGCPNEENAKLFIDFVTSKECQTEQSENWGRRPVRSDMDVAEGLAKLSDLVLVDYDFDWAANEKESIIEHFNDIMVN